ncbi:hypothetical protein DESC_260033 [Desulfosarcina cetonica]|nr:hypothetical protein DESC_260033 [Desulfosarcina cetonica]
MTAKGPIAPDVPNTARLYCHPASRGGNRVSAADSAAFAVDVHERSLGPPREYPSYPEIPWRD